MRELVLRAVGLVLVAALAATCAAGWQPYAIQQLNGKAARIFMGAQSQFPAGDTMEAVAAPYMVYIPEKDRLVMTIGLGWPYKCAVIESSDRGATWSQPTFFRVDAQGKPSAEWVVGTTYVGGGLIYAGMESQPQKMASRDYGVTWAEEPQPPTPPSGGPFYLWDPMLVDHDRKTGNVTRLVSARYKQEDPNQTYSSQGYLFFSTDEGKTWSDPQKVPQWHGVNEIALVRAKNGSIVAACRTDNPERHKSDIDHYCGLAVSLSKDNGLSWTPLNHLYEFGRHHPSMGVLRNGDIVMSYVVREGYADSADGYPQFGIEAVVSRDHGKTWDLDHRYILASVKGPRKRSDPNWFHPATQSTSTLVMPDDSILTAFTLGDQPSHHNRTVSLVQWQLNRKGLNRNHAIRDAPWDSATRNTFDPAPLIIDK
jgi:hypothetical protein